MLVLGWEAAAAALALDNDEVIDSEPRTQKIGMNVQKEGWVQMLVSVIPQEAAS